MKISMKSISSLVKISITSFTAFHWIYIIKENYTVAWKYEFYLLVVKTIFYSFATSFRKILFSPLEDTYRGYYMVAQRYGFYLRVVKTIFYEWVKYCFHHEKMKFISSRHLVIFFLLYIDSMPKAVNDIIDIFTSEDMENMSLVIF